MRKKTTELQGNWDHPIAWIPNTGQRNLKIRNLKLDPPPPGLSIIVGLATPDGGILTAHDITMDIIRTNNEMASRNTSVELESQGWDPSDLKPHRPVGVLRPVARLGGGNNLIGVRYPPIEVSVPGDEICIPEKEAKETRIRSEKAKGDYTEWTARQEEMIRAEKQAEKLRKQEQIDKRKQETEEQVDPENFGYRILKPRSQ